MNSFVKTLDDIEPEYKIATIGGNDNTKYLNSFILSIIFLFFLGLIYVIAC